MEVVNMAKLNKEMIMMIKEIYARRNTYCFIDKTLSPDDEFYERAVSAESLAEAWEVLNNNRERYEFVEKLEKIN
jgi:hypothetical protein